MLNKVTLIGNLGADPDARFMPTGGQVVTLSIATSRRWKDKQSGERKEQTEWHRVIMFNRLAEICAEYLHKGSQVYIEGRLQTRKWEKDGVERYTTEIIADQMTMLGSHGDSASSGGAPSGAGVAADGDTQPAKVGDYDDDIPF